MDRPFVKLSIPPCPRGKAAQVEAANQVAARPQRVFAWRRTLLDALRLDPHISRACKAANISRNSAYAHLRRDARFRRQWTQAVDRGFQQQYRALAVRLAADPAFQRSLRRYPALAEWWRGQTGITN